MGGRVTGGRTAAGGRGGGRTVLCVRVDCASLTAGVVTNAARTARANVCHLFM